jgi:hypothetical protein
MNNGRRKQQKIVFYRVTQSSEATARQTYFQGISYQNQKLQAGPRIFGPFISKSTQRLGACGTDIPRVHWKAKRPRERPAGPIIRKVIPSWAWGGTSGKVDWHKIELTQAQTTR